MPIRQDPKDEITIDGLSPDLENGHLATSVYGAGVDGNGLHVDSGGAALVMISVDVLNNMLTQLKIMNMHLQEITGLTLSKEDIEGAD
jgi:hypothetical protein